MSAPRLQTEVVRWKLFDVAFADHRTGRASTDEDEVARARVRNSARPARTGWVEGVQGVSGGIEWWRELRDHLAFNLPRPFSRKGRQGHLHRVACGVPGDVMAKVLRADWERWMAEEDAYVRRERPAERADVVLSGDQGDWTDCTSPRSSSVHRSPRDGLWRATGSTKADSSNREEITQ
jgi:hypothetical protein